MIKKIIFRINIAFALLIICGICAAAPAFADTDVTDMYCRVSGEKISVLDVDGTNFLLLPSDADLTEITLMAQKSDTRVYYYLQPDGEGEPELSVRPDAAYADDDGVRFFKVYEPVNASEGLYDFVCDLKVMYGENIGTVYLHSDDPVKEGRSFVDASKENRPTGSVLVTEGDGSIICKCDLTQIKARGSSSFKYFDKKSYQIKLDSKAALIEGTQKGKTWILIAAACDPLKINDLIGKELAKYGGEQYAPAETPVNLYFDGEYRGVYMLSEKNQINSNRIDITDMEEYYEDKDSSYGDNVNIREEYNRYGNKYSYQAGLTGPEDLGGYLIEMTGTYGDENNQFILDGGLNVNIKSPDLGSREAVKYISEYMEELQDATRAIDSTGAHTGRNPYTGLYYYDYCDLDSLVKEYMIHTLISNGDGFFRSEYFYKDKGGKMYCGPVWDTDMIMGTGWNNEIPPDEDWLSGTWAGFMLDIPGFRSELRKAWDEQFSELLASLTGDGNAMPSIYDYAAMVKPNVMMDYVLWPEKYKLASPKAGYPGDTDGERDAAFVKAGNVKRFIYWDSSMTYDDIVEAKADWLRTHRAFLKGYFAGMESKHEHQLGEVVASDGTKHTRVCVTCGEKVTEDCIYLASPVDNKHHTAERTCMVCGSSVSGDTGCSYEVIKDKAITKSSPAVTKKQCSVCKQTIVLENTLSKGDTFRSGNFTYKVTTKDKYVSLISSKNIKTAVIPATVKYGGVTYAVRSVGKAAFRGRTKLTTLKVGKNVRTIGKNAFRGCIHLKTVKYTSRVTKINSYAFYGDYRLTKVSSLKACKSIGRCAFYGCSKLKTIGSKSGRAMLNKKVKIGKKAFRKSGIKKIRKVF